MKQSVLNGRVADTHAEESLSRLGEQLCGGSEAAVRQLLVFGRYLHQLSLRLVSQQSSHTDLHRRMLRVSCVNFISLRCQQYSGCTVHYTVYCTSSHSCFAGCD